MQTFGVELAAALREVGRIERSLFMIEWATDPDVRRRALVGLNKGEAHHALKRAIIVCDRFELRWDLDGEDLLLAIDTDLPDEAQLSVRVGRSYYYVGRDAPYVGSDTRYEHEYLQVREPVSRWRQHRRIALARGEPR